MSENYLADPVGYQIASGGTQYSIPPSGQAAYTAPTPGALAAFSTFSAQVADAVAVTARAYRQVEDSLRRRNETTGPSQPVGPMNAAGGAGPNPTPKAAGVMSQGMILGIVAVALIAAALIRR